MTTYELPIPPEELGHCAGKGYHAVGQNWLRILTRELGGLLPNERVLDAGCGVGRIAVPLTTYLNEKGSYEGFDVTHEGIAWCQQNITSMHPNFRFQVADIYSPRYSGKGVQKTEEYKFPYEDESFDVVVLASVFTHFLPREVEHYLSEISRVLNKRGRCVISYFLLNKVSAGRIKAGKLHPDRLSFAHDCGTYRLQNKHKPETAVAHDELVVRSWYEKCGLNVVSPIHYGAWAGNESTLTGRHNQDIILAIKDEHRSRSVGASETR
jgi:ubiquinone/menaquinone biosynthesis C-methylase UbiE